VGDFLRCVCDRWCAIVYTMLDNVKAISDIDFFFFFFFVLFQFVFSNKLVGLCLLDNGSFVYCSDIKYKYLTCLGE